MKDIFRSMIMVGIVQIALSSTELDELWLNFTKTFQKSYHDYQEEMYRRSTWEQNVDYIARHNVQYDLGYVTFNLGINEYSDMSLEEHSKIHLGYKPNLNYSKFLINDTKVFDIETDASDPDTVDWRTKGYVTQVKDQGQCGSCWAFSATGALEGQNFRKTGKLVSLSEQNLMDCSKKFGNDACNGGDPMAAFKYVQKNSGIDTETSYPYQAKDSKTCRYTVANRGARCSGFVRIKKSESILMTAVARVGPISVSIDASRPSFQSYRSGIYDEHDCSTTDLDHSVLIVGYGIDQGKRYWLVKNSWGTSWGENGYIKMSRNKNNQCGIATEACYPTM